MAEYQGTYLSVLPKDLLSLTAEYRDPKLIVSKDNEEISFLFITPLLDFSKQVMINSIHKENAIKFIDAIRNQQSLSPTEIVSLSMRDKAGYAVSFHFTRDPSLNEKVASVFGNGYKLAFFVPSLLINKFCKALADLFEIPFVLEKSYLVDYEVLNISPSNLNEINAGFLTMDIYTKLFFFSMNLPNYEKAPLLINLIRFAEEDSASEYGVEFTKGSSCMWLDHRLLYRADDVEFIVFKDELKGPVIAVLRLIVEFYYTKQHYVSRNTQ